MLVGLIMLWLAGAAPAVAGGCRPDAAHGAAGGGPVGPLEGTSLGVLAVGAGLYGVSAGLPQHEGQDWRAPVDAGVRDTLDGSWQGPADALLVTSLGAVAVVGIVAETVGCGSRSAHPLAEAGSHLAEAVGTGLATYGTTSIIKKTVGRPRPYVRGTGLLGDEDDWQSFPSGHTSMSTFGFAHGAMGIARAADVDAPYRLVVGLAAGSLGGLTTGWMRVRGGMHHWSDVLAGYGIGLGYALVPTALDLIWDATVRERTVWRLEPTPLPGGAGLRVSAPW